MISRSSYIPHANPSVPPSDWDLGGDEWAAGGEDAGDMEDYVYAHRPPTQQPPIYSLGSGYEDQDGEYAGHFPLRDYEKCILVC